MSTDAKRKANARHQATLNYIGIRIHPSDGAIIRAGAAAAGQSLAAYIIQSCKERMERDGFTPDASEEPPKDNS